MGNRVLPFRVPSERAPRLSSLPVVPDGSTGAGTLEQKLAILRRVAPATQIDVIHRIVDQVLHVYAPHTQGVQ
jgi:hypothetical protein